MEKRRPYQPTLFDEVPSPEPVPEPVQLQPSIPQPAINPSNIPANFPESWLQALGTEFTEPYFDELRKFVSDERKSHEIHPPAADVLNAYRYTPLDRVRVVILGQDPYPTPGHAHGLCFSVRHGVRIPASLRNIYKELQNDLGIAPANHGSLVHWAHQGVLLLNAVLTVRSGSPNSHKDRGWERFTDATLRSVNDLPRSIVFVLWGNYAQRKAGIVDSHKHTIIRSAHPSPMSADNGFFGSKPFSRVNQALIQAGDTPIDWSLPAQELH